MKTIFNFNDYLKNPIADYCVSRYKYKTVYTLNDLLPIIQNLKHSKWALENNKLSFVGDQLRLYLAMQQDNFFYVDADCYFPDEEINKIQIFKNCTDYNYGKINNGTFFKSDKNCKFNKYYFDLYNKINKEEYYYCNFDLFNKYPFEIKEGYSGDMKLLKTNSRHFLISKFRNFQKRYPDIETIYYTRKEKIEKMFYWKFIKEDLNCEIIHTRKKSAYIYNINYKYISEDDLIRLWKEQLNYTYQKQLKFIEI